MNDKKLYYIWLQQTLGYGSHKIRTVNLLYKQIEDFYNAGINTWRFCGCFTNHELDLMNSYDINKAKEILNKCNQLCYRVVTIEDKEYPYNLKNIENPPCVLYVKGDSLEILNEYLSISIVGTRNATRNGLKSAFDISFALAKNNVIIISGGAVGIDSQAHKGALQAGFKTFCVLGCGLNFNYLSENAHLRKLISQNGAVISEYPPDYPAYSRNFPIRNRIISALSLGTIVIEAGEKSGSLITADLALKQNKDVFAVPGDILSKYSKGSNALIKDGAKPVTCIEDVIEEYTHLYPYLGDKLNKLQEPKAQEKVDLNKTISLPEGLSENAKNVYNNLTYDLIQIDEISQLTNLKINVVLQAITELELYGLIESYSGKRYKRL